MSRKITQAFTVTVPERVWRDHETNAVTKRRPEFKATVVVDIDLEGIALELGRRAAVAATRRSVIGGGLVVVKSKTRKPDAIPV